MLNFDVPPAGTPAGSIGPLHVIFQQVGQALANLQNDALQAQSQLSVQHAAGPYLDKHGLFYGLVRMANEYDAAYRARILLAISHGKLTISAITAAVKAYYATSRFPRAVYVFDLQSNPSRATGLGLKKCDFVVAITTSIPASMVFFAGRSYADLNTYLVAPDNAWAALALFADAVSIPVAKVFFAGRSYASRNTYQFTDYEQAKFASFVGFNSYAPRPPVALLSAHTGPDPRIKRLLFAGRSYAGRNSYIRRISPFIAVVFGLPRDSGLVTTVLACKAAGTYPRYWFSRAIVAHTW